MPNENEASSQESQPHILVVEDDAFMSGLVTRKLTQEGFEISSATSVDEARNILEKESISLILLDIVLPGTDGLTYLNELKKSPQYRAIPVIITSNLGQEEEIEKGLKEGAADYFVKANTTPGEITGKVKELLGKK